MRLGPRSAPLEVLLRQVDRGGECVSPDWEVPVFFVEITMSAEMITKQRRNLSQVKLIALSHLLLGASRTRVGGMMMPRGNRQTNVHV